MGILTCGQTCAAPLQDFFFISIEYLFQLYRIIIEYEKFKKTDKILPQKDLELKL